MTEKMYEVSWTIDLPGTSARAAAQEALRIHRDLNSRAVVFDVKEFDSNEDSVRIDLDEPEAVDTERIEEQMN